MNSSTLDLCLSLGQSYVPKTITNLLNELSNVDNFSNRLFLLNDFLNRHQEELLRSKAFVRKLPQCMLLLLDAIEILKKHVIKIKNDMEYEANEQRLMQFISMKRRSYAILPKQTIRKYYREENHNHGENSHKAIFNTSIIQDQPRNRDGLHETWSMEGWSNIFASSSITANPLSNIVTKGTGFLDLNVTSMNFQSRHLQSNIRRCWSPELHRKFLAAVDYLGGPEVATPKPIREIMKLEGLTTDQVKSHLQKYRQYIRKVQEEKGDQLGWTENFEDPWIPHYFYSGPLIHI